MTIIIKTPGLDPFTLVLDQNEIAAVLATMGPSPLDYRDRVLAWLEKTFLDGLNQAVMEFEAPQQVEAKLD